jgi:hypothetical protein
LLPQLAALCIGFVEIVNGQSNGSIPHFYQQNLQNLRQSRFTRALPPQNALNQGLMGGISGLFQLQGQGQPELPVHSQIMVDGLGGQWHSAMAGGHPLQPIKPALQPLPYIGVVDAPGVGPVRVGQFPVSQPLPLSIRDGLFR